MASGDVYVADTGNDRVEEFNAEGVFVLMFGKEVNKANGEAEAGEGCGRTAGCSAGCERYW